MFKLRTPIGSNWIHFDRIGSTSIKLDRIGSNWIKLDPICSSWLQLVHVIFPLKKMDFFRRLSCITISDERFQKEMFAPDTILSFSTGTCEAASHASLRRCTMRLLSSRRRRKQSIAVRWWSLRLSRYTASYWPQQALWSMRPCSQ